MVHVPIPRRFPDQVIFRSFSQQFRLVNKSYKYVSKNRRQENSISDVFEAFTFSFCHYIHVRDIVEQHLSSTQFAYTTGGSCTDALLSMQHTIYSYLDEQDCKTVRVFAMDFSKAFDCVNCELLSSKLRQLPLNPLIVNWYLSFLEKRQ